MQRRFLPILLLLLIAYPLFFHGLAERDLWSSHEARAAQNARTMLETGRWAMPRLPDGKPELQKPPLYYWLVAATAWLRGVDVDAWAVRLPAAVAALGCALAVLLFLVRCGRPVAGLLAGLMLATMVHFTWMGRVGRIDMPMSLAVAGLLVSYYVSLRQDGGWRWQLLMYVSAAVAILLKGPVGIVLAGGVILVHALANGKPQAAVRGWWWGVPLVLALVLPWFLYANHATDGEFFKTFFLRHNLQRGLGGDEQFDTHFHPWWFYAYRLSVDLQPWSLLLPVAGYWLVRRGLWRADAEARFGAIWLLVMTLLLSVLDYKRADYLLPAYAGAAILLGCVGERVLLELKSWRRMTARAAIASVATACVIGWHAYVEVFLPRWEPARAQQPFAEVVRQHASPHGMVILFRVESHPLAFHLGRPWDRILEWENLDIWACQPVPVYVIMPPEEAGEWQRHLEAGRLYHVTTNCDIAGRPHDEPLVLLCTRPVGTYNEEVVASAKRASPQAR